MAEIFVPSSSTPAATQVNVSLEELRSKAENPTTSVDDLRKALNDGLEWLLALQRYKDKDKDKDNDNDNWSLSWQERVSTNEKEVASLNKEYDKAVIHIMQFLRIRHIKMEIKIKRVLSDVIKLIEECPTKIQFHKLRVLEPKRVTRERVPEAEWVITERVPEAEWVIKERVIKEIGVPSISGFPTLQNALKEVQDALLKNDGPKFVELVGEDCVGKTIIMQHLNNFFYDNPDNNKFDVVIFIKLAADKQPDLPMLKIAEQMNVHEKGNGLQEVAERVGKVLENKRYLLLLDGGPTQSSTIQWIWDDLKISNHMRIGSKVVITNHNYYFWGFRNRRNIDRIVIELKPYLSRTGTSGQALRELIISSSKKKRELMISSRSTYATGEPDVGKDLLKLTRTLNLLHLILSYPMRIGYEDFLEQWIYDASQFQISLREGIKHILYDNSPLRYVQAVMPRDMATEIINGGGVSREKPLKQVPQPIILLATRLALNQLTLTLTSDTIPNSCRALVKIQNILFSARNDSEKRTVVDNIQANSQIRATFGDLEIIDLNQIDDQTQREQSLLNLATRPRRQLVLVVDENGDKKLDPQKVTLPIKGDSVDFVVFITTLSSARQNDYFSINVDLTINTEDHLLPWELFSKIVDSEHLHSSIAIQEIAVQIVEKCGGNLLAVILMAQSLKHVTDVQTWELALKKLRYRAREAMVNAFFFNVIWANANSEAKKKIRRLRCLTIFKFLDWKKTCDVDLFDLWVSKGLVDKKEAKSILENFMECSLLVQFKNFGVRDNIQLPEDIKIIVRALGEVMPENLSEGALESTISDLQVLNLSYTQMRNLYAVNARPELNLKGSMVETLPEAIFKHHKIEILSLEHCSQLLELPPHIVKLENLRELRLSGCERLETLPQEICELQKLETLSLEHCSQLLELPPNIAKLKNLRELRLSGCERLETLPQEIWELPNLQTISLAGTSIFPRSENQELINSNEHSGRGKKAILSSSSAIIPIGFTLKLKPDRQFEKFCQHMMKFRIQNLEECDLSGTHITNLPSSLNFPDLRSLSLGNNLKLMKIPSSFFDDAPLLTVLDLSRTSIHELPCSIFNLQELREFYLKDCELFVELSPEIQRLSNLVTLDLDGTLITHLPKEIEELTNLESLSLSFYNDDSSCAVIPLGVLSELTKLKVLRIDVNSDNEWWSKHVDDILIEIKGLKMLQALDMYIPRVSFSNPIEKRLSNFRFIIGHHKPRMISRVLPAIQVMFKESGRSLKFVYGRDFSDEVKTILSEASAFFLDRHMKINNLNQFGLKNLKQLQLCILAECNEMQSIVDVDEKPLCMQFLTVFYLKNLRSIINKSIRNRPVFRELKLLALHTCPELTTIFTMDSLRSLVSLEELIVEDCPKVSCIISSSSSEPITDVFLPRLRKLSLLFVPELASISNGVHIGRNLEQMGLYYCPKLQSLSTAELSSKQLKKIRGETKWWEKLKWSEAEWGQEDPPHQFNNIFSPIDENLDILTQLTTYELMTSFNKKNDSGELEFSSEQTDSE